MLLEAFARGSGQREEVGRQNSILNNLVDVANKIKSAKSEDRKKILLEELAKLSFPPRFFLFIIIDDFYFY